MTVCKIGDCELWLADCRELLPSITGADVAIADPPYGETSLAWDSRIDGWTRLVKANSLWCFGSLRMFMAIADQFDDWKMSQEVIWEKHNGSCFHADRFRRVHELIAHFYRGPWSEICHAPVFTNDAVKKTVRRKKRPTHTGHIDAASYVSHDGGPRLQTSVLRVRSCHGYAEHPTQKPVELIMPLIEYSAPVGGLVLDPFMGSGSTAIACMRTGRRFVGIEKDPAYFEVACRRIKEEVHSAPLFNVEKQL